MTIEHIQPLSKGGDSMKHNLLAAHRICNTRKQDRWKGKNFSPILTNELKIQNEKFWRERI
jgi:5-methylcytosine-specific restriction endonuclease McrA